MLITAARIKSQKFVIFGGIDIPEYNAVGPSDRNEGQVVTFDISTLNVSNGTVLYWSLSGTTSAIDFVGDVSSGSVTVTNGLASVSVTLKEDQLTEGVEYVYLQIRTGNSTGPIVAQSNFVNINDTSVSRTYSVSPAAENVDEGASLTFNVTTTNVPDSTTLYWTINSNAVDFSSSSGSFVVNSNSGSFSVTPTLDLTTEGPETFTVSIRTTSTSGLIVATSTSVTINDTSTTPIPTFNISVSADPVNEGVSVTFNITTTNISNGTTLYWTNTGTANAADIGGQNSGQFSISSNTGSVTLAIAADQTTEGSETIIFNVKTGSVNGVTVAQAGATINDTSVNPPPGCCICFGVVGAGGGGGFTTISPTTAPVRELGGGGGAGGVIKECSSPYLGSLPTFCTNKWYTFEVGRGGGGGSCTINAGQGQGSTFGYQFSNIFSTDAQNGVNSCGGQAGRRSGNGPFPTTVASSPNGGGGGARYTSPCYLDGPTVTCNPGGLGSWTNNVGGAAGGGGAGGGGPGVPASGVNGGPGGPGYFSPIVGKTFGRGGGGGGAITYGGAYGDMVPEDPTLTCQWGTGGIGGCRDGTGGRMGCMGTPGAIYFKIPDAYSVCVSIPCKIDCRIYCGGDGFKCYVIGHVNPPTLNCLCFYLG